MGADARRAAYRTSMLCLESTGSELELDNLRLFRSQRDNITWVKSNYFVATRAIVPAWKPSSGRSFASIVPVDPGR